MTRYRNIDNFLTHFKGVKKTGPDKWTACCPAHNDENPSLSIGLGGKHILLKCHAGCDTEDIVLTIGLEMRDLFLDEPSVEHKQTEEAKPLSEDRVLKESEGYWDYKDEDGKVLYRIVRYPKGNSKRFALYKPDEQGQWIPDIASVRRVLYRLPELLTADPTELVYIPEGEKHVDRLIESGFVATCNPFGVDNWKDEYSEHLKGRRVVILPDNDEPGRIHAQQVAESLRGIAASTKVLELPGLHEKGDITDWFEAGHTPKELLASVEVIPEESISFRKENHIITAAELAVMELPERQWIVPGIVPEGLTLLAGKAKVGKSWLCLALGIGIASSGKALGEIDLTQGCVLYLALEDTQRRLKERLSKLGAAPESLLFTTEWPRLGAGGGLAKLDTWVSHHQNTSLVIIDTLARIKDPKIGNRSAYDVDYAALMGLQKLAAKYDGLGIIVVHHLRKALAEDPVDLVSGTTGLTAGADTILVLRRGRGRSDAELFITGRDVEENSLALGWDNSTTQWNLLGNAEEYRVSPQRQQILELLRDANEPMGPKEVSEAINISYESARKLLSSMVKEEQVTRKGRGLYTSNISNNGNKESLGSNGNKASKESLRGKQLDNCYRLLP